MSSYFQDVDDVPGRVSFKNRLVLGRLLRRAGPYDDARIVDVGCGYHGATLQHLLGKARSLTLVDRSLSPGLAENPKVRMLEGELPDVLAALPDASADVVLCSAVLEHLVEPDVALRHIRRIAAPGARCLIAVPSWLAKPVLEILAFRIGLTGTEVEELDEHRMYYSPHDLWPLLVRGGFVPSEIKCRRHWMRLNTLATCRVAPSR